MIPSFSMPRFSVWLKPRYLVETAGFLLLKAFLMPLPVRWGSALGGRLGRSIGPKLRANKTAAKNMARAMPELSPAAREKLLLSMWDNLGRTAFEYAFLARLSRNHARHLHCDIHPAAERLMRETPCRCIFFSAHLANWELMPLTLTLRGIPAAEIYRPPNNPYADRWVARLRRKHIAPFQLAKRSRTLRKLLRHIRQGHAFALLLDQFSRDGLPVKFFNLPAPTNEVLAVLHFRYHYHLLPASIERDGAAPHFTLRVNAPLRIAPSGDYRADAQTLTQAANDMLESIVRAKPEQWLWAHRRWRLH